MALQTTRTGVPSPTGPWIVGLLPLISARLPHVIAQKRTHSDCDGSEMLQFTIPFRNETGSRVQRPLTRVQRDAQGRGEADPTGNDYRASDYVQNENLAGLARLCRLFLKELKSNKQFTDWHAIRRQLSPSFWANSTRGGNNTNDHSQTYTEVKSGTFEQHCKALHECIPALQHGRTAEQVLDSVIEAWARDYPQLISPPRDAVAERPPSAPPIKVPESISQDFQEPPSSPEEVAQFLPPPPVKLEQMFSERCSFNTASRGSAGVQEMREMEKNFGQRTSRSRECECEEDEAAAHADVPPPPVGAPWDPASTGGQESNSSTMDSTRGSSRDSKRDSMRDGGFRDSKGRPFSIGSFDTEGILLPELACPLDPQSGGLERMGSDLLLEGSWSDTYGALELRQPVSSG
jgi:hypothetical protein